MLPPRELEEPAELTTPAAPALVLVAEDEGEDDDVRVGAAVLVGEAVVEAPMAVSDSISAASVDAAAAAAEDEEAKSWQRLGLSCGYDFIGSVISRASESGVEKSPLTCTAWPWL